MRRYCELFKREEVSDLQYGMDFRKPEYRREVFLRFYEFHLRYRAHPGCVYYLFPYLAKVNNWTMEQKLWFAFINGNTQNPVTSWLIFQAFPSLEDLRMPTLTKWFEENRGRLAFDTDRRYHRGKFPEAVARYKEVTRGKQEAFFETMPPSFLGWWNAVGKAFLYFGRLSRFSYLEYLRIMGLPVQCDTLFLRDLSGSKSHRNGLCKVLGRDDLDWHDSNPEFDGTYSQRLLGWLEHEASQLLNEARERTPGMEDVGYFTMESALCTYKSWHRPNRRYPNVYNDMLVERIRTGARAWGEEAVAQFWAARKACLPPYLRLEDNPKDPGVVPTKQNHYRLTGEVIMMDRDWPCFKNSFNDTVNS